MTDSLEQKLQQLKEKAFPRTTIGDTRFRNQEFTTVTPELVVKLSDVEDFVELYQKTRQTLQQQAKSISELVSSYVDSLTELSLPSKKEWIHKSLLDRPNEDYIVIKRKQLEDKIKKKTLWDWVDKKLPKKNRVCLTSMSYAIHYFVEKELLGLPKKKKETTK